MSFFEDPFEDVFAPPFDAPFNVFPKIVPNDLEKYLIGAWSGRYQNDYGVDMTNSLLNGDASNGITNWGSGSVVGFQALSGAFSYTATAQSGFAQNASFGATVIGEKYLITAEIKSTSSSVRLVMGSTIINSTPNLGFVKVYGVHTATSTGHACSIRDDRVSGWDLVEFKNAMVIKLSTVFGLTNEPTTQELQDMLTYKGKTFWNGTEKVVINPLISGQRRAYWADQSGQGRHLHLINSAYDANGGMIGSYPAHYLADGINDYPIFNSVADIVAVNGAYTHFGVYQAKGAFASPHRLIQLSDGATSLSGDLSISATAITFTVQDSTSGTSVATITTANALDTWVSVSCVYDPVNKKAGISRNGSAITYGSALTNGTRKITRIVHATNYLLNAFNNVRVAEDQLFNKTFSDADAKAMHNLTASRYGLTRV